ncbi:MULTISPECIES: hypothetical protein [Methanoculleus]|uniref:Uncharacterized protein n=2 Tax=Methanoculleus TaxID=45989 RepID=A3CSV8_METMJ|nr:MULTISPECIES: hypothetical protein [Methanoculleus]ABN56458.1 hypothetical protein Memar_0525 [Methanoculleus marisnigri JR1]MCC7554961.1 hypothetical protein [Methanoculleus marisnigri]UYU17900.1 hypothetical protein OH143_09340 [Methanoculleus submarinus]
MKRIIAAVMIVFLLLPGFAAAAPGNGSLGGEQVGNSETNTTPGGEQWVGAEENTTLRAEENVPDRQRVRTGENETAGDRVRASENTSPRWGEDVPDRNRVRLAVHALLGAENRTGGIGENVSAIAREINNSVQKTFEAEEQIRARHGFMRFLFGGDAEAARLIEEEAQRNRERAAELGYLIGNCTCDDATRAMLQEQVRTIEQEQDRLRVLASEEMQVRGLFSWR